MMILGAVAHSSSLLQMGGLLLVGALTLAWAKKRNNKGGQELRSLRLTSEHALHVVRFGERQLLIGTGRGQTPMLLTELVGEPPEATGDTALRALDSVARGGE